MILTRALVHLNFCAAFELETRGIYFGQNLVSRYVLIFRSWVTKWSFWGHKVKGDKLIGRSAEVEG
jgi:hypothetical protein